MLIALTFDDGPNTSVTPRVLDILEEHGIVATFFLIGQNITPESAQVVRRAKAMGCDIENHSVTHGRMNQMTAGEIRAEVQSCTDRITAITGEAPKFFRPPYIAVNRTLYDSVALPFICGVGCEDWMPAVSAQERADRVLAHAADGQIVLLHDMEGNTNTVEALQVIIPELKRRGFAFVTVARLFQEKNVIPQHGWLYSNVLQTASDNRL